MRKLCSHLYYFFIFDFILHLKSKFKATKQEFYDHKYDVIIVGKGWSGLTTALFCQDNGLKTILISPDVNGYNQKFLNTSEKSVGAIWVPNNHYMRDLLGTHDEWEDFLMLIKDKIDEESRLNVPRWERHVYKFFINASKSIKLLESMDIKFQIYNYWVGNRYFRSEKYERLCLEMIKAKKLPLTLEQFLKSVPERYAENKLNKNPVGRVLSPRFSFLDIINTFRKIKFNKSLIELKNIILRKSKLGTSISHLKRMMLLFESKGGAKFKGRCTNLILSKDKKSVKGVYLEGGKKILGKHVVICAGGFSLNDDLRRENLPNSFGSCASSYNKGDWFNFNGIMFSTKMNNAYLKQQVLPNHGEINNSSPMGIWSYSLCDKNNFIITNLDGKRIYNEGGMHYHERGLSHNTHKYQIFICDSQYRNNANGGYFLLFPQNDDNPSIIKGLTIDLLISNIKKHLAKYANVELPVNFKCNVHDTLQKWNIDALRGFDSQFQRGERLTDHISTHNKSGLDNSCIGPITHAPFYALVLVQSTLDTCSGIVTDEYGQTSLKNCWAIGNCTNMWTQGSYISMGATIGPILAQAYTTSKAITSTYNK